MAWRNSSSRRNSGFALSFGGVLDRGDTSAILTYMPRNVTQDNRLETEYPDFLLSAAILRVGWSQVNRSATMDSFDDRPGHIWYDGALVPWKDATLHVLSHALHSASCMFQGVRVSNGRHFKLHAQTQRLSDRPRT